LFERSLKVADTHHFSHAAHQLNLSPSLVTRHVGDLESHLGVKLLQRSARKTVLTKSASAMRKAAARCSLTCPRSSRARRRNRAGSAAI
jgi:DNA-binding transcriptional LysR family regulator